MKIKHLFCFLFLLGIYASNAQLVINGGAMINVNGGTLAKPISVVLNNPPPQATAPPIKTVGVGSGVILESEYNRIHYNLSATTTTITVPYASNNTGSWVVFPLAVYAITAGTNTGGQTGAIRFSTTKTAGAMNGGFANSSYMPTQVGNVCGVACAGDNSANIIDRFWVIEPVYYSTRPAVTFDFTYIMGETDLNSGNTASLALTLQPQRFDTTAAGIAPPNYGWNGFPSTAAEMGTNTPQAITATSVGTMTGVQVSAANFFPDWTLANYLIPLPVEIVKYTGKCENNNVTLSWTSASEINSFFYTIEKSSDGINYTQLTTISAIGNSNHNTNYSYIDVSPGEGGTYYRLSETDKNNAKKVYQTIFVSSCKSSSNENGNIYSYHGDVNISLYSLSNQNITITAYDVTGRLIYQNQLFAAEGSNSLKINPSLAQGVYLFELKTEKISLVKRILIEN